MFGLFDSQRDNFRATAVKRYSTVYEDGRRKVAIHTKETTGKRVLFPCEDDPDLISLEPAPDRELAWLVLANDAEYERILEMLRTDSGIRLAGFTAYELIDGELKLLPPPWGPDNPPSDSAPVDKPKPASPEEPDSCEPGQG